ncbi:type II toxin-antitoxin system VapC family toxin [Cupriavidus basilensis]|uniref:Type II toxin-antitoxin system VapC family toxin n=1 Tax=Cupriavidus basilensis TaxID=68895 RepID=A0ABT6B1W3_9BURK|nr:type II toxin-antitoxin system VapC family toxin [Cupriavidus basilensis]MDF3838603.1 type II toxin-antitoxin system VapC family toxin [Cupriavidus basilensis]
MRLLLDTHIALWACFDDERLSPLARELIETPSNEIWVSAVSLWEIAIKRSLGKLPAAITAAQAGAVFRLSGYQILSVEARHALLVETLPTFANHKDPFDRMLIAQVMGESMVLLTEDRLLPQYGPTYVISA